jgi:hypothetical protein
MPKQQTNGFKTVPVPAKVLQHCAVKAKRAADMTREEVTSLMSWCDCQREDLWDNMSLQEILNVYRATAAWMTFEAWAEEDRPAAHAAWNAAVIAPGNKMRPIPS